MWNYFQQLFRTKSRRDQTGTGRPVRLRPCVERLESRALLSVAPSGNVDWFAIGTPGDADVQLPAAQDVSITVSYSGKFELPTDVLAGGPSRGSVTDPNVISRVPSEPSKDGGMIDWGSFDQAGNGQLYAGEATEPAANDALPPLQYMPRTMPPSAAIRFGGPLFSDQPGSSSSSGQLFSQPGNSQTATERLDSTFKSQPNGQSEKAASEANPAAASSSSSNSTSKPQDDDVDGGMINLLREPVIDESAQNATAAEDEDLSTLDIPLQVERSYGRFQAFEVSTAEEIGAGPSSGETSQALPSQQTPSDARKTSASSNTAKNHAAAVDQLFALAATIDEMLDQDTPGDTAVVEEAPLADIPLANSDRKSAEALEESTTPNRGLASLPVSTVAAAVIFASVTRATRRPRRRDDENGIDSRE